MGDALRKKVFTFSQNGRSRSPEYALAAGFINAWINPYLIEQSTTSSCYRRSSRLVRKADVFDYIEVFYKRFRRYTHLGGVGPEAFEMASV